MKKILIRITISLLGAFLGLIIGGILTYLIFPSDKGLIFLWVFVLITSQIGMIVGSSLSIWYFDKRKNNKKKV